jgi:tRNA modification GTPase
MSQPSPCVIQLTPPGRGAVATLRVEGRGAVEVVQLHFRCRSGRPLATYPADRLIVGYFGADRGEEVVLRRYGDAAVELHCHGGRAAVTLIEETLVAAGCQRLAWRDWAAGQYPDAITAAALTALADARTERTAAILLDQYQGALRRALSDIQQALDRGDRSTARRQIDELSSRVDLGRHLVEPWQVVLAGRVNVGKSSLINALAGYDRSIVHPTPGTTRDAVTLVTAIDGWPVELCDTAGMRGGGDAIERAGIELARERLAQADLVVLVCDRSAIWSGEDQTLVDQWPAALVVHNKCDLPPAPGDRPSGLLTSAVQGDGIAELLAAVAGRLVPTPPPAGGAVPFTAAQIETLGHLRAISRCGV